MFWYLHVADYHSLLQPRSPTTSMLLCKIPTPEKKRKKKENHHLTGASNVVLYVGNGCAMSLVLVKRNSDFSLRHCDIPLIYCMLEVVKKL